MITGTRATGIRLVFTGPGRVELEFFPVAAPEPGQILVQTLVSVVSPGTERANLLAIPNTKTAVDGFPFYPGYSNVGRVIEVGAAVETCKPGDLVATMAPHMSHVLVRPPLVGPERADPGGVFPREAMLSEMSWCIPADLADEALLQCASLMILTVALHGVRLAAPSLGSQVIVVGLGPVGLAAGLFARAAGAYPVIGISQTRILREHADALGFDGVFESADALRSDLHAYVAARESYVIEAIGRPDGLTLSLDVAPVGSRVILLGCTRGMVYHFDPYMMVHRKAITMVGAHQPTRGHADAGHSKWEQYWDAELVLRLIHGNRVSVAPLIGPELAVAEVEQAFTDLLKSRTGLMIPIRWSA